MTLTLQLDESETQVVADFRLPDALQDRLRELLDRQDAGTELSPAERGEAEGLVNLAEFLSLLRLCVRNDTK